MKVEVLTLLKSLFSAQATEVILPGEDGELSVWDLHQPCLYSLRAGKIIIRDRVKAPPLDGAPPKAVVGPAPAIAAKWCPNRTHFGDAI